MVAWVLWYRDPSAGWVLAIALAPLGLRLLAGRGPVRRTPLDVPLGAFLLTTGLGVWTAYDRAGAKVVRFGIWTCQNRTCARLPFPQATPVGWQAFWGLVLAVLVYYALAAMETKAQHRWGLAFLVGLGAAVAIWFAAANDWRASPAKVAAITRLGEVVQRWLPVLPGRWPNTNVPGGVMATCVPFGLGLVIEARNRGWEQSWPWAVWGLVTGAITALGLILTTSRGGWIAVAASLALAALWWLAGRSGRGRRQLVTFLALVGAGLLVLGVLVLVSPSLRGVLQRVLPVSDRLGLFYESVLLLRDYFFTGFGLGEFALVHSTYALLIHVPVLVYAHSLYLDVALGQGLFGFLALIGVLGGAAWVGLKALARAQRPPPALVAGLLSLVVVAIHGFSDSPLYTSRWGPLLWVSAGLVVAGGRVVPTASVPVAGRRLWSWRLWGAVAVVGLALLFGFWRPLTAAWYANLGAVRQTWTELSQYDYEHFDNPSLDEIRRQADLSVAERFYARAVALDAGQVTARTRLAEIALSRGGYDQALAHVQAAWDAGHRDRVTRLLLGDALVAAGDVAQGVAVVRGLEWAEGRLDFQGWYRYWLGGEYGRAADAWRAVVQLNPENHRAARSVAEAEAKAERP
jgi:O-antigen ligase